MFHLLYVLFQYCTQHVPPFGTVKRNFLADDSGNFIKMYHVPWEGLSPVLFANDSGNANRNVHLKNLNPLMPMLQEND